MDRCRCETRATRETRGAVSCADLSGDSDGLNYGGLLLRGVSSSGLDEVL